MNHCHDMASATSHLTSMVTPIQPRPPFLDRAIMVYGNRSKCSPRHTCSPQRKFAAFNYYRNVFGDNKVAQRMVQLFWEQYGGKVIDIEELAWVSNTLERYLSTSHKTRRASSLPADAKRADVYSSPTTGHLALQQERHIRMQAEQMSQARAENKAKGKGHYSITTASGKSVARTLAVDCERCREARIECDAEKPACAACSGAEISVECTYTSQKKSNRFQRLNDDVNRSKKFYGKPRRSTISKKIEVTVDREKENEGPEIFSNELNFQMSKESQTRRNRNVNPQDSHVRRKDEPTPRSWKANQEIRIRETVPVDLSRLRLHISNGEEYNPVNSVKLWVQNLTGQEWDWWPLCPSSQQLLEEENRIRWHCVSHNPHCLNPAMLKLPRLGDTHIGQCFLRLAPLRCLRIWRGRLLKGLPLQRDGSQNHHQSTI